MGNACVAADPYRIVKRLCASCSSDYQTMYYRRLTDPSPVSVYDLMRQNWFDANNVRGTDFNIYSSETDAYANSNAWAYCNYDDPGIGFPRDCGKTGGVGNQWN